MKKFLFAIGAAALVFTLAACGDLEVNSVGIDTESPGNPGNVVAVASPDGNWALVSWRTGGNTEENSFEIVARPAGHTTIFTEGLTPANLNNFVSVWGRPIPGSGIALAMGITNRVTLSWNYDSSLDGWEPCDNIDTYYAVVPLHFDRENVGNLEIGVRAINRFQENWAHPSHSGISWAGARLPTTRDVPTAIARPSVTSINHPAGSVLDLNSAVTFTFLPTEATNQSVIWNVTALGVDIETNAGVFTPARAVPHTATAVYVGSTTVAATVTVNVTGSPGFIPVTTITGDPTFDTTTGALSFPGGGHFEVMPADASYQNIVWQIRTAPVGGSFPTGAGAADAGWRSISGNYTIGTATQVQVRATIANGRHWTQTRNHVPFSLEFQSVNSSYFVLQPVSWAWTRP